ncbi:MAG: hypothetical protein QY326_03355 [Bdellovibrionota bacterium]|nr:MAG: hypothetical protein QY326_03355 [Bdellovibrionota bacterium]
MPTTSHSVPPAGEDSLSTIADVVQGWTRSAWCGQVENGGMEFALPLVAAAARHAHRAIDALASGELSQSAAFSAAAMISYNRANGYHRDIDGFDDFVPLRYVIEALLIEDLPTAREKATEFISSMQDYGRRIVEA